MTKRYRIHTTATHIQVLYIVARLVNATPKAVSMAMDSTSENHYRGYLNDLHIDGYLYKKTIYGVAQSSKGGMRLGTLYALTKKGAEMLQEEGIIEGEIYHYKEGIRAKSPLQTMHRIQLIHILALLLQMEKQGKLKVLEIVPYFQKRGALALGQGKATNTATTEGGEIIPDALACLEVGGKVRVIAFELHRATPTTRILSQLARHTEAIESGAFSQFFGLDCLSFVCSIHEQESTIKNTIQRKNEIADFERFIRGFHFTLLDDLFSKGFENAFYMTTGEKSRLFQV